MEISIIQLAVTIGGTLALAIPFGLYIARMISYEMRPLERPLAKIENGFYKLIGIDINRQMSWKEYFFAIIITNGIVAAFVFIIVISQGLLPLGSPDKPGFTLDLAFNTAASFITDTNLQHYIGDQRAFQSLTNDCYHLCNVCGSCICNSGCICFHSFFY